MKIVAVSDTHCQHSTLKLPEGDVLIHAGDISGRGSTSEVLDFIDWFGNQDFETKIFIAGNHDFYFEKHSDNDILEMLGPNVFYLNDSGVEIDGIHFWGSPITPWFFDWAFNRHRGPDIKKHWDLIPNNTDVLITHGPMYGILDKTADGDKVGCKDLLDKSKDLTLKAHICGHIHEAYGIVEKANCTYINASVLNEKYRLVNAPIVFEI